MALDTFQGFQRMFCILTEEYAPNKSGWEARQLVMPRCWIPLSTGAESIYSLFEKFPVLGIMLTVRAPIIAPLTIEFHHVGFTGWNAAKFCVIDVCR